MLRKQISQAAVMSLLIMIAAIALDYVFSQYAFRDGEAYDATMVVLITLLVAPAFIFYLIR